MADVPERAGPVTYLMSHFPAITHTFIHDEVTWIEHQGVRVAPVAINPPDDLDGLDDAARAWLDRTTYVKSTPPLRAAATFLRHVLKAPRIATIPFRCGGLDLASVGRHILYLVEASLVVDNMMSSGSRHLHVHFGGPASTVAWLAHRVARSIAPNDTWTWSMTIHGWSEFVDEERHHLRSKVESAAFTACISSFTRAQLLRLSSPSRWDRVQVVRCGIDLTRFSHRQDLPASGKRVAIVGRVSPEKGHLILVDAVALLAQRGVHVDIDVIGPDRGMRVVIEERLQVLGLSGRLHFHGACTPTEIADLLRQEDALCLPTFAEGLPIVLMEAMAIGVPVVTTYIAGIPELAEDGTTALVVPAAEPEQLADALERVLTDGDLRTRLVENAAERVRSNHDIRRTSSQLAALFRSVTTT